DGNLSVVTAVRDCPAAVLPRDFKRDSALQGGITAGYRRARRLSPKARRAAACCLQSERTVSGLKYGVRGGQVVRRAVQVGQEMAHGRLQRRLGPRQRADRQLERALGDVDHV